MQQIDYKKFVKPRKWVERVILTLVVLALIITLTGILIGLFGK